MANSNAEHSAAVTASGFKQPELLSSKYQRKAKLQKFKTVQPPKERETVAPVTTSEAPTPNSGTQLPNITSGTTLAPEAKVIAAPNTEDTNSPIAATPNVSMRDDTRLPSTSGDSEAKSPQPSRTTPPPSSPEVDNPAESTTPRQPSPTPASLSKPPQAEDANQETEDISHLPQLSAADLDRAKNLVLDLLGWGVQPEYLLTAGLSHELVFRVFADLNLRMPTNLKITDTIMDVAYSLGRDDVDSAANQPP